jgi:tetratricopeptide (TPR) repeat protein
MKNLFTLFLLVFLISCAKEKKSEMENTSQVPECISYLGRPLFAKIADSTALAKSDSAIAAIRSKSSLTEDDYIDIGSKLIAVNKFNSTVDVLTEGLAQYPNSFKLLRQRGHRYLNLRQPEKAIDDLEKAEALIRSQPEVWENDATGKPTSTVQHQIWYHIGVYHFLKRNYTQCVDAFEKSLATAHGNKSIAGSSDWLYNAYQRANAADKSVKIEAVLKPYSLEYDIDDKEYPYFKRLLLYKGLITPAQIIDANKPVDKMILAEVTKLYGLANWYAYQGKQNKADSLYRIIIQSNEWPGFAISAAEKDLEGK